VRPRMADDLLASSEFFADVDSETRLQLAELGNRRRLVRGDVLFAEGDDSSELFVVIDGRIAIANRSTDGRESVVALMEAGDLFGEMALLDRQPRSAEARALEPSIVLAIPYEPVQTMFEERPELLWGVVRMLSRRLRNTDEALADSVFLDVTGRTAKRLLELAAGADEFLLPITQEELAGMVGASRERVNKAIASFIRLGWLAQQDRRYKILQRDRLELRAR
jgi:CRP/FNR family transcriptional regulator, cyclic AMP receptor protein